MKNDDLPADDYRFPAPWTLHGWGFIATWFSKSAQEVACTTLTHSQRAAYAGGPVVLMLVRYAESECGPYDELLFIPGRLRGPDGARPLISRIWVSTQASVENGRRNWAIPKQLASFEFSDDAEGRHCKVQADGLDATLAFRGRRLAMPVTTGLLPSGMRTLRQPTLPEQRTDAAWCETTVSARGKTRAARCQALALNGPALPASLGAPSMTLLAENFSMVFPVAQFPAE